MAFLVFQTQPELEKFFRKMVEDVHREQREKLKIKPKASPLSMENLEPIDLEEMSDLLSANGYEVKKSKPTSGPNPTRHPVKTIERDEED